MIGKTFGIHLTLDMKNCDKERLIDNKFLSQLLKELPKKLDMIAISPVRIIKYKDAWAKTAGYTGGVYIATSHICFHTFPDNRYCFLDIFSCTHFDAKSIADDIIKLFGCDKVDINIVERGKDFNPL